MLPLLVVNSLQDEEEEDEGASQLDQEWTNYRDEKPEVTNRKYDLDNAESSLSALTAVAAAADTTNLLGDDFIDDIPETADLLGS